MIENPFLSSDGKGMEGTFGVSGSALSHCLTHCLMFL